jgi:tRNA threonylcarbamoyladenosine biosynthesis protein TsaE
MESEILAGMVTFISNSPGETEGLGRAWASEIPAGTVIGLQGDLGAGKTCLVRGFAAAVGISGRVHSPTFALINEYDGPGAKKVFHLDLYRLNSPREFISAGLEQTLLTANAWTFIEWIDRLGSAEEILKIFPRLRLRYASFTQPSEMERQITYADFGF